MLAHSLCRAFFTTAGLVAACATSADVPVRWLGDAPPPITAGVSFGVPWARGAVQPTQAFSLQTAAGETLPVQTWPLAYWPDGSLKWSGVATVAGSGQNAELQLRLATTTAAAEEPKSVVRVSTSDTTYLVDTGRARVRIPKIGTRIIDSIVVDGREVARDGQLVAILQDGPDGTEDEVVPRERYGCRVDEVTLEQSGPVRAVVKISGRHLGGRSGRAWLPFVVRLYLYAGQDTIRLVHTIVYDGDESRDFIRGLGITFAVPLREQIHNRHVRFSGEGDGLWAEPVQPMVGRGGRFVADPEDRQNVYPRQADGERVPNREQVDERGQGLLADWAVWSDFKLAQPNADGFTIVKRTNGASA
ncbi:MAG TPA: Tat pathway signal sequence domain protein, partial [Candidatus Synoicihabitans sp.]|nr:Tat pathway signal sequence domain protein [Candidatus Synoicihabitans sp.]